MTNKESMKIEAGKFYKARKGIKIRIYATDGKGEYTVHGAKLINGIWFIESWDEKGKIRGLEDSPYDIVSEWREPPIFDLSCLPAWARFIAMDGDGEWTWFTNMPVITEMDGSVWSATSSSETGKIPEKYSPKEYQSIQWTSSLFSIKDFENNK